MKHHIIKTRKTTWESPPARGRGLKLLVLCLFLRLVVVAPCAGAWIET